MVKPKNYRIKSFVREKDFLTNNFKNSYGYYLLDKPLYKEEIILHLSVDKEDNFMSINVNYANGTVFAPFYNPDDRGNNNLYKKVVKAYNKLMSNMKDIFEEVQDEND